MFRFQLEGDIRGIRPKSAVTDEYYESRLTSGQRTKKILQNRLDHTVKRLSSVLTKNKELRTEIDHLLKERGRFNLIWDKLIKDIAAGKKIMVDLIEQATLAFDQREEWCLKVIALQKRAQSELLAHSEEMREIQRKLDHDVTLREFLIVKGQKRILKDLEEKERQKQELEAQRLEDQLHVYEKAMEKIQEFCQEQDVQRITSFYLKQEEENFALFNYVNELNHEIELLNASIKEKQEKIEEQMESKQLKSNETDTTIKKLEETLENIVNEATKEEALMKQKELEVKTALDGVERIYRLLVSDQAPILELLDETSNINLFNVKIYLGTIEKNISDLINESFFIEKPERVSRTVKSNVYEKPTVTF